jgi:hypothetical protein
MSTMNRFRRELRLIAVAGAFALAMAAAIAARSQVLSGGVTTLSQPFMSAGGGAPVSGGTLVLAQIIGGGTVTQMGGGTLALTPGGLGIPPAATSDFSFVHAFPTPFQPSLGHDRITFRGLPPKVTIKVYTMTGQLVQTLTKNDPFSADLVWKPVQNASGRKLASGVYFYQVTGDKGRASGKLMVIR